MMELKTAGPGREQAVAELWAKVYGDDGGFLERFYADCVPFEDVTVAEEDGAVRTILTAPAVRVHLPEGREVPAGYMYALASEPTVRNRGLGRDMMRFGAKVWQEKGAACTLLVPAEPSLFRFFDSLGYVPAFSHLRREYTAADCPDPCEGDSVVPAGPEEYNALRRKWLEGRLYMDCPTGMIAFQQYLARESGGDLYRLELPGGTGCAVVEGYDGVPVIKELLCAPEDVDRALGQLKKTHPAERYVLRLPVWVGGAGERVLWGAVGFFEETPPAWWPEGTDGYLGIALD